MIPNYENYDLIGIGDFSHGDENILVSITVSIIF